MKDTLHMKTYEATIQHTVGRHSAKDLIYDDDGDMYIQTYQTNEYNLYSINILSVHGSIAGIDFIYFYLCIKIVFLLCLHRENKSCSRCGFKC